VLKKAQAKVQQLAHVVREKLPEHQIYLRANGKVRFFTVSTATQVTALSVVAIGLTWSAVASWSYFGEADRLAAKDRIIAEMNDRFDALTQDLGVMETQVLSQASLLEQRQNQINSVLSELLGNEVNLEIPDATENTQALVPLMKSSSALMSMPEGALPDVYLDRYSSIEARQDGLVTYLRDMARVEMEKVEETLTTMNLSTGDLLGSDVVHNSKTTGLGGTGGPLLETESDARSDLNDDSLEDLMADWDYLRRIRSVIQSIPSMRPAKEYFISSKFGRREDPIIKGSWAFHSGLDLGVWYGSKVMAPTDGVISFAGYRSGYGKMVEIDHGNGFKTRFGHLRRITVKRGKAVKMGEKVAESGNTGRSTGPHLHYEVWFKGKPVDPTPYLEASQHVLEIQRRAGNG
jgi:murein DD-endopeptidase MepM/ murein hydrolase activator NlpD